MDPTLIQPVVLVGGKSRRFGRDKLREPIGGEALVSRPIAALRAVFGPCVGLVGACDPAVAALGDLVIPDPYPGVGPAGGVLAALEHAGGAVFVLSGDLPAITPGVVRSILDAASDSPGAHACLGFTGRPEPCIGLYRPTAIGVLRASAARGGGLGRAIDKANLVLVPIAPRTAQNINRREDLPGDHTD
ncbi:MAG: molybdenum cofactor guanylyltransferase [Phycisphaeraceae bacterium]|nr:MAG: molybdenum cofactor guanylyltransferase [Phycisphaeraceae bacterium]